MEIRDMRVNCSQPNEPTEYIRLLKRHVAYDMTTCGTTLRSTDRQDIQSPYTKWTAYWAYYY